MPSPRYSILLSVNDLEAEAIARLGRERGHEVVELGKDWGGRLDPLDPALRALKPGVILVETPHPEFEAHLRALGKVVHIVDHHISLSADGTLLDRRHPRSSLEQVAALLGVESLDKRQRRISANDRGFIPALAAMEPDEAAIRALRQEELTIRRARRPGAWSLEGTEAWLRKHPEQIRVLDTKRPGKPKDPCLVLVQAPAESSVCLLDAVYGWWQKERQTAFGQRRMEVLALYQASDDQDRLWGLEFSGAASRVALLDELAVESRENTAARLTLWAGGGEGGCFFGASDDLGTESKALNDLADRMLNELLTGNRPIISWRSHFLQVVTIQKQAKPFKPPEARNKPFHCLLPPVGLSRRKIDSFPSDGSRSRAFVKRFPNAIPLL